jgi:hypothetical protein
VLKPYAVLAQGFLRHRGQRLHLQGIAAGGNHKIIGHDGYLADVKHHNVRREF